MPASSNHFTILSLAKILRTKTRYDFRFLATTICPEILDNILIVPEFKPSNLVLNVLVADTIKRS